MARRRANAPLLVYLNGRLVGRLRRETSGAIDFQYDPSWLGWEHAIPASLWRARSEGRDIGAPGVAGVGNQLAPQ